MSFAARMMAKMGHTPGSGLGKSGEGIIEPVEVKMRPQGAGVGAVREKTEQYKREHRRAAEARGEEWEDSSEEEKKARRRRKERQKGDDNTGSKNASGGSGRRAKVMYKTVEEVKAAAPGLDVPIEMLGSIVDATGSKTKLLTSTAGLMTMTGMVKEETSEEKIRKRERLELEAFIESWHGLQEKKVHVEQHEGQIQLELNQMKEDVERTRLVLATLENLTLAEGWDETIKRLEKLQQEYIHEIDTYGLGDLTISMLAPLMQTEMEMWDPLEEPSKFTTDLSKLVHLLGLHKRDELMTSNNHIGADVHRYRKQKATSAYETLIYRTWLPKIRTAILHWDAHDSQSMVALVEAWRPLLPVFVYNNLIDQSLVPKLKETLSAWKPNRKSASSKKADVSTPHTWLFPWLPSLPPDHLDPKASTGVMSDVKAAIKSALSKCDITAGPFEDLEAWRPLLSTELSHLLVRYALPRLASYLSQNLVIDPSDQQLKPFDVAMSWLPLFKPEVFARLLVSEFFPKVLSTLHQWLQSDQVEYTEIDVWLKWWKSVIPKRLFETADVQAGFNSVQRMVVDVLDILERGGSAAELAAPAIGPARPLINDRGVNKVLLSERPNGNAKSRVEEQMTFKDVVEESCAEHDLTMIPLREAHHETGNPLYRITASATSKGGVVVYFTGTLIWAQKKGMKGTFDPIRLEDLVTRAESR